MKSSHHIGFTLFEEFAVLPCYAEVRRNEPLRRYPAETNDDNGSYKLHLLSQIRQAKLGFLRLRVTVVRRTALDHVCNVYILISVEIKQGKIHIEKPSAFSDKGKPLQVLLLARAFADEHYLRLFVPRSENKVCPCFSERTFKTISALLFKGFQVFFQKCFPLSAFVLSLYHTFLDWLIFFAKIVEFRPFLM